MRVMTANRTSAKPGFGLAWLGLAGRGASVADLGLFQHFWQVTVWPSMSSPFGSSAGGKPLVEELIRIFVASIRTAESRSKLKAGAWSNAENVQP